MSDETQKQDAPAADAVQPDPEAKPAGGDGEVGAGTDAPAADAPAEPPAQAGDPEPEVSKPEAKPVLQSIEAGKAELDANPGRTSVQTDAGVLVREP